MTDKNSGLSRRKVLIGIAGVGGAGALGSVGTYAALSDTQVSGIDFTAGSIGLEIQTPSDTFEPAESYSDNQGEPVTHEVSWEILNTGTLNATNLKLTSLEVSVSDAGGASKSEIIEHTILEDVSYEGQVHSDAPSTLQELNSSLPLTLVSTQPDTPELPAFEEATRTLSMSVYFDYTGISGDGGFTVSITPTFRVQQQLDDQTTNITDSSENDTGVVLESQEQATNTTDTNTNNTSDGG
ncbi:MAG: hypothetical protein J07AB43_01910 [Candidatus Nanosalina sp. J07AB43]|nr:MAG: hypothetical protein J07AB43_01910 [Candidatus Nanosalina sp. J07AB43]